MDSGYSYAHAEFIARSRARLSNKKVSDNALAFNKASVNAEEQRFIAHSCKG